MKNNDYIDILITVVLRSDYVKLLIKSIDKFTTYSYKISIITDVRNEKEQALFDELTNYYSDRQDIQILESINPDIEFDNRDKFVKCPGDGRKVGMPSFYKSWAYETGIKATKGKYVCMMDYDCVFLGKWTEYILPLVNEYFFVSAMWRGDLNIARDQFFIYDRQKFDKHDLIPDCSIGDTTGNVTHFANNHNFEYYICPNSARHWGEESLRQYHVLNLQAGEQIFVPINDEEVLPFLYHYGRGSAREEELYKTWQKEITKYLESN